MGAASATGVAIDVSGVETEGVGSDPSRCHHPASPTANPMKINPSPRGMSVTSCDDCNEIGTHIWGL